MKKAKIIVRILLAIILIVLLQNYAVAAIDTDIKIGTTTAINSSKSITEKLLGTFQVIGSVISVIALAIIGLRYMFSSVDEKAQMKGVIIYYVIGAVLVFATSNLLSVVYKVINSIN